ncbi:unnamed protein product [Victoria cruziana]
MMGGEKRSSCLQTGGYIGDISALCLLHVPGSISSRPFVLAGTGSQILLYDIGKRKMLNMFNVFEGVRVHGIFSGAPSHYSESSKCFFNIAVYGEKRVKLFQLAFSGLDCACPNDVNAGLLLIHSLPKFGHWVMDVCLLKVDGNGACNEKSSNLAIGFSDNSICLWDVCEAKVVLQVQSPEKCLLYSMRFWGDNLKHLRIASGTIYNQILVWTIAAQKELRTILEGDNYLKPARCKYFKFQGLEYKVIQSTRLVGHEGSIFRITWSSDGSKLMSVSDDRSARIWCLCIDDSGHPQVQSNHVSAQHVLFGHSARIWDCHMSESLVISAGEDCTCRIWGTEGGHLLTIKEHAGRGIWRCLYDPTFSLLITAGFDSVIKVHPLAASLSCPINQASVARTMSSRMEVLDLFVPDTSCEGGVRGVNSKSEYVRCLRFAREDTLYVATNHGYLYHVNISFTGSLSWTKVVQVFGGNIVCMDVLSLKSANVFDYFEDWIAVGDAKGNATVVKVIFVSSSPEDTFSCYWTAERERQLLGIYWSKSLSCSHIFTADPGGRLKLWRISDVLPSVPDKTVTFCKPHLAAEFISDFGARVVCLDASFEQELLVCGDQRGNLIAFSMGKSLMLSTSIESANILPCNHFKGAHGIGSVTSISISGSGHGQVNVHSTGRDGCICYFVYEQNGMLKGLNFVGLKRIKEICAIDSFHNAGHLLEDLGPNTYAIGFASADFIIWDLANEFKILQVSCGGWRRPYSYFVGDTPESQNCLGYVKDNIIHVHRVWVPTKETRLLPRALHLQFHGREIHSLCFIYVGSQFMSCQSNNHLNNVCWIATGSEDGTVRLTRYTTDQMGRWSSSKLLGEHVGGSAVRSIYFVRNGNCKTLGECGGGAYPCAIEEPLLLISAGAKRVLTCWIHNSEIGDTSAEENGHDLNSSAEHKLMTFHWLCNHVPSKFSSTHKKLETGEEALGNVEDISLDDSRIAKPFVAQNVEPRLKHVLHKESENDWRYLSVTAFVVKSVDSKLLVCFVVVACSDATLTLRALLLPCRLWFDVALLVPQTSPVLSLQHIVIPMYMEGELQIEYFYLVVSGSTDGSISFWDLTTSIRSFMSCVSEIQPGKLIDCSRRPRTGRGSQGGRWWKTLNKASEEKDPNRSKFCWDGKNGNTNREEYNIKNDAQGMRLEERMLPNKIHEVEPLHVMHNIHQSGVNCLHISQGKENIFHVISGGDDQALHYLSIELTLQQMNDENMVNREQTHNSAVCLDEPLLLISGRKNNYILRFLHHHTVASSHSSAVKGVWTDGIWVFSTGLDQRVRSWHLGECGKLVERACLIVDVPEPEGLDAKACGSSRNRYQIVIGGRGMQMVEFVVPCDNLAS